MTLQVGVKLLIKGTDQRYLFLRRAPSYKNGTQPWDIPGGRIEPDEPLEIGLARELAEETGMKLTGSPRLIAAQDIFVPAKDLHVVRLTYIGTAEGEVAISDEHSEYAWMTKTELLEQDVDHYIREISERF